MNSNMADFIAEHRKAKGLTQKQLADKLGVTDKAVSKWERGKGYPDISYLEPLAEALEVTVGALLQGKEESGAAETADNEASEEKIVKKALNYVDSVYKARRANIPRLALLSVLILGFVGILTTAIVDFALNGGFTWSLIPICAIIYFCLCVIPLFTFKRHAVAWALLATSIFLLPFLATLNGLTGGAWFRPIAVPMSLAGLVLLWLIYPIFRTKLSIWNKLALALLMAAAGNTVISFMSERILHDGGFDVWNLMSVGILVTIAAVLFGLGRKRQATH